MIMKEEALKLADELDALHQYVPKEAPDMIRSLVEELDKTPLSDEEILDLCPPNHSEMMNEAYTIDFARAIEERHGIK